MKEKMRKTRFTLNQTWTLCLRMWKWIKAVYQTKGYEDIDVVDLKMMWLERNGLEFDRIRGDCFFCDYKGAEGSCYSNCPGAMVDPEFGCDEEEYAYDVKPDLFYKELLRLNRIRKANKPKRPRR